MAVDDANIGGDCLALGAAWCTNTWDLPTYGPLVALVLVLRLCRQAVKASGDDEVSGGP